MRSPLDDDDHGPEPCPLRSNKLLAFSFDTDTNGKFNCYSINIFTFFLAQYSEVFSERKLGFEE